MSPKSASRSKQRTKNRQSNRNRPSTRPRQQAARRQQAPQSGFQRAIVAGGVGILLIATLAAFVVHAANGGGDPGTSIKGVKTYTGLGRGHVSGTVDYKQTPPVGGDHNPVPQTCGAYSAPIANENGVHSMEHGAVWITYQPDLDEAEVAVLQQLATNPYVLVSPYPGLPSPVVASAWGKQVRLTSATDARLQKFLDAYREGPQAPEQGSACSGVGTPVVSSGSPPAGG
jgi:hypothetical protein